MSGTLLSHVFYVFKVLKFVICFSFVVRFAFCNIENWSKDLNSLFYPLFSPLSAAAVQSCPLTLPILFQDWQSWMPPSSFLGFRMDGVLIFMSWVRTCNPHSYRLQSDKVFYFPWYMLLSRWCKTCHQMVHADVQSPSSLVLMLKAASIMNISDMTAFDSNSKILCNSPGKQKIYNFFCFLKSVCWVSFWKSVLHVMTTFL